ncbi:MAG TPA: MFS transporter [Polyangiales bacterium]
MRTFALTWLAYASYCLGRKGFSVTKVALASQLHLSTATLAAIDTAFLAAYALGQVPAGLAADRLGARKLVGFGMLASAAACASRSPTAALRILEIQRVFHRIRALLPGRLNAEPID